MQSQVHPAAPSGDVPSAAPRSASRDSEGPAQPRKPKVGDRIKDNDPRMAHRGLLTIIEVMPYGVLAEDASRRVFSILTRRIHTDGKPRKGGFDLVGGGQQ